MTLTDRISNKNDFHNCESGHPKYKEIVYFWLLFHKILCFGPNFLTDDYFSIPLSLVINIFPVLHIDTNIDHIYGQIDSCHNGHFQQKGYNIHYGVP